MDDVQTEGAVEQASPDHGLYDLTTVPEELRSYVEPHLQQINKSADKKIREQAESLKRWEPLQGIEGIDKVDPAELQALLQFRDIAADPDQLAQWIGAVSEEMGLSQNMSEESWAKVGQENGWLDDDGAGEPDANGSQEMTMEAIVNAVKEALMPEIEPIRENQQRAAEQQAIAAVEREMREQLDAIKSEHGDLSAQQEEDIISLAGRYVADENPIAKGFDHYQRIRGNGASDALDDKLGQQNGATLNGGVVDTTPKEHTFASAKEAARARLTQV